MFSLSDFGLTWKTALLLYIGSLMWVGDAALIAHFGWNAAGIFGGK